MSKIPKAESKGEAAFALHCRAEKLDPVREYVFHPTRKWRLDFFFPGRDLAVEIEGTSTRFSRHLTLSGFREDCVKYNAAALMGITVLRYPIELVMRGDAINDVLQALGRKAL